MCRGARHAIRRLPRLMEPSRGGGMHMGFDDPAFSGRPGEGPAHSRAMHAGTRSPPQACRWVCQNCGGALCCKGA